MKHIVMFSGGIGSWATAKRVIDEHGPDDVVLVFCDVKGDSVCACGHSPEQHEVNVSCDTGCGCSGFDDVSRFNGEDEDVYRFIRETADRFGVELVWLTEGRNIWQVFRDDRFLGNSRLANCSKFLKQRPAREWLEANCTPEDATIYVGISWDEIHRLPAIEKSYQPFVALAPMCDKPYLDKHQMLDACRQWGVEPPRPYREGWPHANCQGACVRAGHAQWKKVLTLRPELYAHHEAEEEKLRQHLDKDVSILRDWKDDGVSITLRTFRERIEDYGANRPGLFSVDELDWGGCGCFVEDNEADE